MLSGSRKKASCPIPINGTGCKSSGNGSVLPSSKHRRSNATETSSDPQSKAKSKTESAARVQPPSQQRPGSSNGRASFAKSESDVTPADSLNNVMPVLDDLLNSTNQNVLVQQRQLKRLLNCLDDWDKINVSSSSSCVVIFYIRTIHYICFVITGRNVTEAN